MFLRRARSAARPAARAAALSLPLRSFTSKPSSSPSSGSSSRRPAWFAAETPRQVMSGIQPTGVVHLGNYLGALVNWALMQESEQWQHQKDLITKVEAAYARVLSPPSAATATASANASANADSTLTATTAGAQLSPSEAREKVLAAVARAPLAPKKVLCQLADLHALTTNYPRDELVQSKRMLTATLMALGMRQEHSAIFAQSSVPQNSELAWVLTCLTPLPLLFRMTQFKDKAQKAVSANNGPDSANGNSDAAAAAANANDAGAAARPAPGTRGSTVAAAMAAIAGGPSAAAAQSGDDAAALAGGTKAGLLMYPALMAADMLIFRSTHVPVGADQTQHIEFCRDLAREFNDSYCNAKFPFFPRPQGMYPTTKSAARIMSLRNPGKKMSKSEPAEASRLCVTDSDASIMKKVRTAVTDSQGGLTYDPVGRPGVSNLIDLLTGLSNHARQQQHARSASAALAQMLPQTTPEARQRALERIVSGVVGADANDVAMLKEYKAALDAALTPCSLLTPDDIIAESGSSVLLSAFKTTVGEAAVAALGPIRDEVARLTADGAAVDATLRHGAEHARAVAQETMGNVYDLTGLGIPARK